MTATRTGFTNMAKGIEIHMPDQNTIRVNEAVEVKMNGDGTLSVIMLKTPNSGWATNRGGRAAPGDVGVNIPVPGAVGRYTQDRAVAPPQPRYKSDYDKDPYVYSGYRSRGFTIGESTRKATDHVYYELWDDFDSDECGDYDKLKAVIRQIIVNGKGRHKVYQLGGRVKNFARNGWNVKDKPLLNLFQALALEEGLLDAKVV